MLPIIHWNLISLELFITMTLVILIVVDLLLPKDARRDWLGILSFISLFGLMGFWLTQQNLNGATFGGMFILDSLAWFFKGFFLLAILILVGCWPALILKNISSGTQTIVVSK